MSLLSDAVVQNGGNDPRESGASLAADEVKVNVDTVLLTLKDERLHVALAPREYEPYKGELALVGAIMRGSKDADLEAVVVRSLRDKAGLKNVYFEQLNTFSGKSNKSGGPRDIRWPSISVAYIALVPYTKVAAADAIEHGVTLAPVEDLPALPFDHTDMIEAAVSRLRGKGAWSVLPAYLLEEEFTIPQMNDVYTKVVGNNAVGQNFRRKVIQNDMLVSTGYKITPGAAKKAEHFRLRPGVSTVDARL
jgi:ADP-ribose pyrophosphatase YjhB (NUDIX family)